MSDLTQGIRTTGQIAKKVGSDALNAAIISGVVVGIWSLVVSVRRVWKGQPINGNKS